MNRTYLLIGGNMGDRLKNLQDAIEEIRKIPTTIVAQSRVYETAPWGITDQPAFLNMVLQVDTELSAPTLLTELLKVEKRLGRKRGVKFGPRTIDIDILFFNDDVITSDQLTIPHPEVQNRRFALKPLCDVAPNLKHPTIKKTVAEMLSDCDDTLDVKIFSC